MISRQAWETNSGTNLKSRPPCVRPSGGLLPAGCRRQSAAADGAGADVAACASSAQDELVAESLVDYAWACSGQSAKGESYAREALDIYRKRGTAGQPVISALWVLQKSSVRRDESRRWKRITEEALNIASKTPASSSRKWRA